MDRQDMNRTSGIALIVLSSIAFLAVLSGYIWPPPQADEGSAAHIFQLSIIAQLPTIVLFLASADWKRPLRSLRPVAFEAVVLVLALVALYHLEHT